MNVFRYILHNHEQVLELTLEHLRLVGFSTLFAMLIGIPLGIVIAHRPRFNKPVLASANIIQTIPSLALFGFLLPVPWLGERSDRLAILALTLYALLPIIRNTFTGIRGVDSAVVEAGRGMGLTESQLLFQVELPLAVSVILSGVRVAIVISVGLATIAAAIGAGGLGEFIFRGLAMVDNRVILAGAIPAALLALLADFGVGWLERRLAAAMRSSTRFRISVVAALALLLSSCSPSHTDRIVVGSKNFTESFLLGEMMAQMIETRTHLKVDRRFYLAGTYICQQAILAGRIDVYPEYTGTALTAILKENSHGDKQEVYQRVKSEYQRRFGLEVGPSFGFNDTFAMEIRGDEARRLNIKTLSQAAAFAPQWRAGFGYEFMERPDGYRGLASAYGLHFAGPPRIMDLGLLARALKDHQIDLAAGNTTDGQIRALGLFVLEDDRHYFPPYEAVPIIREQTLQEHPEVGQALSELAGKISDDEMQQLNYEVEGQHRDAAEVAREFLKSKGLVP